MRNYRRLTEKAKNKLEFYNKSLKIFTKTSKFLIIFILIILLFLTGIISFCIYMYNKHKNSHNIVANNINVHENSNNLTEIEKKELERESEKQEILSDSQDVILNNINFYDFSDWNNNCAPELIVINAGNKLNNSNIQTKICRGKEVSILMADDLENMIAAAFSDNIKLWISSGYRDINLQTKLFNRQVEREKSRELISQEEAERRASQVVARPYTSEHNTGLAVDFNGVEDDFYKTQEYKWLQENAHKYGFIERYQEKFQNITGVIYEPWHFRYVGKEHAEEIKQSNLCLEKYVEKKLIKN